MVLILSSLASSDAVSGGLLAVSVSESAGAAAVGPLSLHSQASSSFLRTFRSLVELLVVLLFSFYEMEDCLRCECQTLA